MVCYSLYKHICYLQAFRECDKFFFSINVTPPIAPRPHIGPPRDINKNVEGLEGNIILLIRNKWESISSYSNGNHVRVCPVK